MEQLPHGLAEIEHARARKIHRDLAVAFEDLAIGDPKQLSRLFFHALRLDLADERRRITHLHDRFHRVQVVG